MAAMLAIAYTAFSVEWDMHLSSNVEVSGLRGFSRRSA